MWLVIPFFLLCLAHTLHAFLLENQVVRIEFCENEGGLRSFYYKSGSKMDLLKDIERPGLLPIWSYQFVAPDAKPLTITSSGLAMQGYISPDKLTATLIYSVTAFNTPIEVKLVVSLQDQKSVLASWDLQMTVKTSASVSASALETSKLGVWDAAVLIPSTIGTSDDGELYFPSGLGHGFHRPLINSGGQVQGVYPSGGVSMQYMGLVDDPSYSTPDSAGSVDGLYVGVHDITGQVKGLQYTTLSFFQDMLGNRLQRRGYKVSENSQKEVQVAAYTTPFAKREAEESSGPKVAFLSVTATAPGAGAPLPGDYAWKLPFTVSVGILSNINHAKGRPLWYEASLMYREHIVDRAPWAQRKTSDVVPSWYRDNALWLNTHWQCFDVFNKTGGDPSVVKQRIAELAVALEQPHLALHWYEWQQGPNPSEQARYKFDTHYPDYFPGRDGFKQVMKDLREQHGVMSLPYINGRIFDVNSTSYINDDGEQYCAKQYQDGPTFNCDGQPKPTSVIETYGSGATFCVGCPSTQYWQDKISDTSLQLLQDEDSAGVYIDQIGASPAALTWPQGGGNYWAEGYNKALQKIDDNKSQSLKPPIVTEDIAEPYMGSLQGNLVLTSFRASYAQQSVYSSSGSGECPQAYKRLVPAYPVVYGGHYTAMGAEWFRKDWEDGDWLAGKMSAQFASGAQLGWFSVIGMAHNDDSKCGPMGVGDLLLDPAHKAITQFLKDLASARRTAADYFVDGTMGRPPVLTPVPDVKTQMVSSQGNGLPLLDYDSVSSSSWSLGPEKAMFVFTNNCERDSYSGKLHVDLALLQLQSTLSRFTVFKVDIKSRQRRQVAELSGYGGDVQIDLQPREVLLLEVVAKGIE